MATVVAESLRSGGDSTADRVLCLLDSLRHVRLGLPVNQLDHALQTAARAEAAGAPDEMIVAALCHDVGKAISGHNHGAIAAEILRPFVSAGAYAILRHHEEFRYADYPRWTGVDPRARLRFRDEPWYRAAVVFADEWDRGALDPDVRTPPLDHYSPLVRTVLGRPGSGIGSGHHLREAR
ncbi:HD domain-containing protein [Microbispora sp. NPDC046973]|uniref:HD domain-containing protein n=1 Tax=Microbispora sp. NPDC046973 TaxID=3155022 RepID=UPI00340A8A0D